MFKKKQQYSKLFFPKDTIMVLLIYCLHVDFVNSFQNNYSSIDRTPTGTPSNETLKFVINAPFSYCDREKIPTSYCYKIGLNFASELFQRLNHFSDFNSRFYYDPKTSEIMGSKLTTATVKQNLAIIENHYFLPGYKKGTFGIPTEGQIVWLMENGYIPKQEKGTHFIVKKDGNYQIATLGEGFDSALNKNAKLYRLVSKDIPSSCSGFNCEEWQKKQAVFVLFKGSVCLVGKLKWKIEHSEGSRYFVKEGKNAGGTLLPANAKNVTVGIGQGSIGYAFRKNVDITDFQTIVPNNPPTTGGDAKACYVIKGSTCFSYDIHPVKNCNW